MIEALVDKQNNFATFFHAYWAQNSLRIHQAQSGSEIRKF